MTGTGEGEVSGPRAGSDVLLAIDLVPAAEPTESFDIPIPQGDPWFDPAGTGTASSSPESAPAP